MRHGLRMLTSWKFLTNRERIIFKDKREAFTDFCRVSGASILFQIGLALVVVEFGFPTPDIIYDIKKTISPDFEFFSKYGNLVEYQQEFENRVRSLKREETILREKIINEKPAESRFGGIA